MAEYTYKDIIIDPKSEEARNCVGKRVCFGDNPTLCLSYANSNNSDHIKILGRIELDNLYPFVMNDNGSHWGSIILCKEDPEPEYVPFDSIEEFVNAAIDHSKFHYLSGAGIWIRWADDPSDDENCFSLVNACSEYDNQICIGKTWIGLEQVLYMCRFVDGTRCGKLKGEEL